MARTAAVGASVKQALEFIGAVKALMPDWEWLPHHEEHARVWGRWDGHLIDRNSGRQFHLNLWPEAEEELLTGFTMKYSVKMVGLPVEVPIQGSEYGEAEVVYPEQVRALLYELRARTEGRWQAQFDRCLTIKKEGLALADAIARALGGGWRGEVAINEEWTHYEVELRQGNALVSFLWGVWSGYAYEAQGPLKRYRIRGEFSPELRRDYWRELPDSITCSAEKTPERIAGEIKRRVLPGYLSALSKAEEAKGKDDDYRAQKAALAGRLEKAGGELVSASGWGNNDRTEYNLRGLGGLEVNGTDSVAFKLSVTGEQAEAILRLLRKVTG